MSERSLKLDWDNTYVRGGAVAAILVVAVWGTRWMASQENAVSRLTVAVAESAATAQTERELIRTTMRDGFAEIKAELQRIAIGSVQTRQADAWIEQFEDRFNRWVGEVMVDNPTMKLRPFKPPALPK